MRLNNKFVKFVDDGLTTKEEMAPPSREFLKTLVWWGQICDSHFRKVYKISQLHRDAITSLVSHFKTIFPGASMDYLLVSCQKLKKKAIYRVLQEFYLCRHFSHDRKQIFISCDTS